MATAVQLCPTYLRFIRIENWRCAPRGGGGKGPAFRMTAIAALSSAAEPELRATETRPRPPFAEIENLITAVPREFTRGFGTRLMRRMTCPG